MNKAVDHNDAAPHDAPAPVRRKLDWRRRMSDNIAYALLTRERGETITSSDF